MGIILDTFVIDCFDFKKDNKKEKQLIKLIKKETKINIKNNKVEEEIKNNKDDFEIIN